MAGEDPFDAYLRTRRGVTLPSAAPMAAPKVTKEQGDAQVSTAKGQNAPHREKAETENIEARTRNINANANKTEIGNKQATGEAAQNAYLASRMNDIGMTGALFDNIQNARNLIGKLSTGPGGQLTQGLWGSPAADLSGALDSIASREVIDSIMRMKAASRTGATGFGQLSDREGTYLMSQLGSLKQRQSPEQLMRTLNNIEASYRKFLAYSSGIDPTTPEGAYWAGLVKPSDAKSSDGAIADPQGHYKWEPDPALRGVNNTVIDMIKAGRSEAQIKDWLNGINPNLGNATDIQTNIDLWKAGGEPRVNIEGKWVPKGDVAKFIGDNSDNAAGAYGLGAADVLTGGFLDEMSSDPNLTRAGMAQADAKHGTAYGLGQFGGGALSAVTGEGLLARGGIRVAPFLMDAAHSATYGAGSADDNYSRWTGAGLGGLTGLTGGALVRGGTRAVGAGLSGLKDQSAALLNKYNIPMTIGQMLPGGMRNWEERATSWPLVGGMIRARRADSMTGFNKAAFDHGLEPIGQSTEGLIGQQGVAKAYEHVGNAYNDALDGTQIVVNPDALNLQLAQHAVHEVPTIGPTADTELRRIIQSYVGDGSRPMTGHEFQAARQEIRALRSGLKDEPGFKSVKPAIDSTEDALTDAFAQQNPGQLPKYLAADEAYKRTSMLADAVDMSPAGQNGVFSPAGLRQQVRSSTRKFSGRMASSTGNRPFNDLVEHGSMTLPSTLPSSGTAERLLLPLALGAVTGAGKYLASGNDMIDAQGHEYTADRDIPGSAIMGTIAALAAATPYSRSGQRAAQWLLGGRRSPSAITIGDLMTKYASVPGRGAAMVSAPAFLDRTPNPTVSNDILVNKDIIDRAMKAQREMAAKEGPAAIAAMLQAENGAPDPTASGLPDDGSEGDQQ